MLPMLEVAEKSDRAGTREQKDCCRSRISSQIMGKKWIEKKSIG